MSTNARVQDLLADPDPPPQDSSPIILLLGDLRLFLTRLVPHGLLIFLPITSPQGLFADVSYLGLFFQVLLFLHSLLFFVPLLLLGIFVGGIAPILVAFATNVPLLFVQGHTLVEIPVPESSVQKSFRELHSRESWIYINGLCTSRSGLVLSLRRLETLFQRPIVGVHNRTLGLIGDLLECIPQRILNYATQDVRAGYLECKRKLQNEEIDKVVLICHSQGGIIVSLILDQLLTDVSQELLQKLEIYTFANAASHFSNPSLANTTLQKQVFPHIEHYANGRDPVAQIGVLAFSQPTFNIEHLEKVSTDAPPRTNNNLKRFNGRLFVRWKVSGHLLLSHYLGSRSILDTPEARLYSRLRRYIGGNSPAD